MRWLVRRLTSSDEGSAIVEFVFVAVVVLVPLVYLVVAVASVQRSTLAVTQAAREAGRAFATAGSTEAGLGRARAAVRLAVTDEGLPDDVDLRFVSVGSDCDGSRMTPELRPGMEYAVCVTRHSQLPGVPAFLSGRGVTTIGRYVVHVDDYRAMTP